LRNIKNLNGGTPPSILKSLNPNLTEAIINSDDGLTVIMSGMYKNGRALVFYKNELAAYFLNSINIQQNVNLFANVAKWITQGSCTNLSKCVISIDKYRSYMNVDNLVVVYPQSLNVNTNDPKLIQKIESGSWGIIFAGDYFSTIQDDHKNLMKYFGICPTKMNSKIKPEDNIKWCDKIPQTKHGTCG